VGEEGGKPDEALLRCSYLPVQLSKTGTSIYVQYCHMTFKCLNRAYSSSTANEGPVRIQYKCLVPIYVFPEMKLLFPKQNYNVPYHISVRDLYVSRIGLPILLQGNMWTDPGAHRHMNVEIGTEAAQFPGKENGSGIFLAVCDKLLKAKVFFMLCCVYPSCAVQLKLNNAQVLWIYVETR
jgi:hypothetical protein